MIRVMIVDDQRPTRMGLALMVAKDPTLHVVAQAANGQEALDQLATAADNQQSLPDVILMDVRCLSWTGWMPPTVSKSSILK